MQKKLINFLILLFLLLLVACEPPVVNKAIAAPTNVSVSDGDVNLPNGMKITWSAVPNAEQYYVYKCSSADGTYQILGNPVTGTEYTYTDTTVNAKGVAYYFKVTSYAASFGHSLFSNYDVGYIYFPPPYSLSATDGTYQDRVVLTWDAIASSSIQKYYIYRKYKYSTSASYTLIDSTTAKTYTDMYNAGSTGSITMGSEYYYCVSVKTSHIETEKSNADVGYCMLSYVQNLKATQGTYTDKVRVSWTLMMGGVSYYVYRNSVPKDTEENKFTLLDTLSLTQVAASPYYDDNINMGRTSIATKYYYQVKAKLQSGKISDYSPDTALGYIALPAVTNIVVGPPYYIDSIKLSWDAVSGANSYNIYRSVSEVTTVAAATYVGNSETLNYVDYAMSSGMNYYYYITALKDKYGESPISNSAKTHAKIAPAIIDTFVAEEGKVRLVWNCVKGAQQYHILRFSTQAAANSAKYYEEYQNNSSIKIATISAASDKGIFRDSTMIAGKIYYYKVVSQGKDFYSDLALSNVKAAYSLLNRPKITNISKAIYEDSILITWASQATTDSVEKYKILRSGVSPYESFDTLVTLGVVTSYADKNIYNGRIYHYKIIACNTLAGNSFASSKDSGYSRIKAPINFSASKGVYGGEIPKIKLTWKIDSAATAYEIYRYLNSFVKYKTITNPLDSVFFDEDKSNVVPGKLYSYYIISVPPYNYINSYSHNQSTIDTGYTKLDSCTITASKGSFTDRIKISISLLDHHRDACDYFYVERKIDTTGSSWIPLNASLNKGITAFDDVYKVLAGYKYYYRIKSYKQYYNYEKSSDKQNYSEYSNIDSGSVRLTAPSNFTASKGNTDNYITLSWKAAPLATEYSIERKRDDESDNKFAQIFLKKNSDISTNASGNFEYKDSSSLTNGYAYYYRIRSLNSSFGADNLASDSAVDYGYKRLPVPILYKKAYASEIADSIAGVFWEDFAYASSYTIHRMENDSINKTNYKKVDLGKIVSYGDTSLGSGKKYYFALSLKRVSATKSTDTLKISDTSNYVEIFKHIKAPINFLASNGDTTKRTTITFTWGVANRENPTGFLIYEIGTTTSTLCTTITNSSATSAEYNITTDVDANRGKPRYFAIKAYNTTLNDTSVFSSKDLGYIPLAIPVLDSVSQKRDTNKVHVYWQSVPNATWYALYRAEGKTPSSSDFKCVKAIYQNDPYDYYSSIDTSSLIPGQYYTYKIKAISDYASQGVDSSSFSVATKLGVSVLLPPQITASIGNSDSIVVSWNAIAGATGYEVYRKISYETEYIIIDTATTNSYSDTSCANSVVNYYKVKSYRKDYTLSDYSDSAVGMTKMGAPTNIEISKSVYNDSVRIKFIQTNNAEKYEIYRSINNKNSFEYLASITGNSLTAKITANDTLDYYDKISNTSENYKGIRIFYQIRSYNSTFGYSNFTSVENWGCTKIPAPTNIKADSNYSYVQLSWDKVASASNYYIYKDSLYNIATAKFVDSVGNVNSYYDTSGLYGKKYYYWVLSRNIDNFVATNGYMIKSDFPTNGDSSYKKLPVVEMNIVSKGAYSDKIFIQWKLNPKAYIDSYFVFVNENSSLPTTTWEKIASLKGNVSGTAIDTFNYQYVQSASKPLKGKKYYFMVKAIALGVKDTASSLTNDMYKITGYMPIVPPTNLTASKLQGFDTISLKWNKVNTAEKYYIYRMDNLDYINVLDSFKSLASTTDTFYYDKSGVERGKKYYYKVKSYNQDLGSSIDYSNIDTGYVKIKPPTNIVASVMQYNDTILVSWEKASGAAKYSLQRSYLKKNGASIDTIPITPTIQLGDTSLYVHQITNYNWNDTLGFIYKLKAIGKSNISSEYSVYSNLGYPKITIPKLTAEKVNQVDSIKLVITNNSADYTTSLNSMKFEIYRSTDNNNFNKIATDNFQGSLPNLYYYDTISLLRGIRYFYKVKKVEQDTIFSSFSNMDSSFIKLYNPDSISATKGTQKEIILTWSKVDYAQKYYIYRLETMTKDSISVFTTPNITDSIKFSKEDYQVYLDSANLVIGKNYYYAVRATNDVAGVSFDKYNKFDSGYTAISYPMNIRTINNQESKIGLAFDQIPKAKAYLIKRSMSQYTGYSDTIMVDNPTTTKDSILFEDNGTRQNASNGDTLIKGKIYWYKVATVSETGYISDYSDPVYGYLKLPKPTNFTASRDSLKKVELNWNKVGNNIGNNIGNTIYYEVYRKKYNETSYVKAHTEELIDSFLIDNNVAPYGRKISYKLRAYVKDNQIIRYSDEATLDSAKAKLLLPDNFTATKGIYTNQVVISWRKAVNNGPTKYILRRKKIHPSPGSYTTYDVSTTSSDDYTYSQVFSSQSPIINYDNIYEYSIQAVSLNEDTTEFSAVDTGYIMLEKITFLIPSNEIKAGKIPLNLTPKANYDTTFYIYRATNINFENETEYITTNNQTSYVDSLGIVGGVKYYYRVRLKDARYGFSNYSNIDSALAKLEAPANLIASRDKYAKVELQWEAVAYANGYKIYKKAQLNTPIGTVTSLTYTDTNITSLGSDIEYRVRAYLTDAGESDTSKVALGFAKVPLIDTLTATIWQYTDKITLKWNEVKNASGYLIYRSDSLNGTYDSIYKYSGTTYDNKVNDGVKAEAGKLYYYRIKTYANLDTSSLSGVYAKGAIKMNPPTMVSASNNYSDRIKVIYNKKDYAQVYQIFRDTLNNLSTKILLGSVLNDANDTVYSDQSNLKLGKLYYYTVKAGIIVDGVTYLSDSASASNTGSIRPGAPQNIAATFGLYSDSIVVTWDNIASVPKYNVYLIDTLGGTNYKDSVKDVTINKTKFDTLNHRGLSKLGYPYKIMVVSDMANINFMLSDSSGYAYGATKLAKPKIDSIDKGKSTDSINIYWNDIDYETTYKIYKADSINGTYWNLSNISDTMYSIKGVDYGKKYYYKILAYNFNTRIYSDTSAVDSGYARLLKPNKPNVSAELGKITLSWSEVINATKYVIIKKDTANSKNDSIATTSSYNFEDTTVSVGVSYQYRIVAKNSIVSIGNIRGSESDTSAYSIFVTPKLPPVENIEVSQGTYMDSIKITWKHVSGAVQYFVIADTIDIFDTLTSRDKYIAYLDPSGTYPYTAYRVNGKGLTVEPVLPNTATVTNGMLTVYWKVNNSPSNIQYSPKTGKKYYFNICYFVPIDNNPLYSAYSTAQTKTGYLGLKTPNILSVSKNKKDTIEVLLSNVGASVYNLMAIPKTSGLETIYSVFYDTAFYLIANSVEGEPYAIKAYASIPSMGIVSDTVTSTTDADTGYSKLTAPIDLKAEGGDSTISLSWTFNKAKYGNPNLKGAQKVYIYRKLLSQASFSTALDTLENVQNNCTYVDSLRLSDTAIYVYMLKNYRANYKHDLTNHLSDTSLLDTAHIKIKKPKITFASKNYNDSIVLKWEYKNDFDGLNPSDYSFEVAYSMTGENYNTLSSPSIIPLDAKTKKIVYLPALKGVRHWFKVKLLTTKYGSSSYSIDSIAWAKIPAPTAIDAENGTSKITLNFNFDVNSEIDSFYIFRSDNNTFNSTKDTCIPKVSGTQKMTYTDSNLTKGKFYYYKVQAKGDKVGLSDTSATYDSAYIYLSAPAAVTAEKGKDTLFVKVTWNKATDAKKYYIYKLNTTTNTYIALDTVNAASFNDPYIQDSTALYGEVCQYRVKTVGVSGLTSDLSSAIGTGYLKLPIVKNVKAAKAESDQFINVSWNKALQKDGTPLGNVEYKVLKKTYIDDNNKFKDSLYSCIKTSTADSFFQDNYNISTTQYSQHYKYYVIAKHRSCEYSSSDTITYTNDYLTDSNRGYLSLPIPTNFKMSYNYSDSIVFSWDSKYTGSSAKFKIIIDSSGTIDSFINIDASKKSYTWKKGDHASANKFSLIPGKLYFAQIYLDDATNNTYSAKSSKVVGFITPEKLAKPTTNVTLANNTNVKNDTITINWNKLVGTSDTKDTVYQIWVADSLSASQKLYTQKGTLTNKNDTFFVINPMSFNYDRGAKIYFKVVGAFANFYDTLKNVYGETFTATYTRNDFINLSKSASSDSAIGFTKLPKPMITNVNTSWSSIEIYWTAIDKATKYEILKYVGGTYTSSNNNVSAVYYKDSGSLALGQLYNYRIIAKNGWSLSDTSEPYGSNISLDLLPPNTIEVIDYYDDKISIKAGNIIVTDKDSVHLLFSSNGSSYSKLNSTNFNNSGTSLSSNVMKWQIDTTTTTTNNPNIKAGLPYYFKTFVTFNGKVSDTTVVSKSFVKFKKPASPPTQSAYYTDKIQFNISSGQTNPSPSKYMIIFRAEQEYDTIITGNTIYYYDLNRKISLVYGKKYFAKYAISSDTCMVRDASGTYKYYYSDTSNENVVNDAYYLKFPYATMLNSTSYADSIIFTWQYPHSYVDTSNTKLTIVAFGIESEANSYTNKIIEKEYALDSLKAKLVFFSSFKKGKKYYFRTFVKNTNITQTKINSDTTEAISSYFKLEAPTSLTATKGVGADTILLKWNANPSNNSNTNTEIRIFISTDKDNQPFELYKSGIPYTAISYNDTIKDVAYFGKKLYYKLAYYSIETGTYSAYSNVDSGYCRLKSPTFLVTNGDYKDSIVINLRPVYNAKQYYIHRYQKNAPTPNYIKIQESTAINKTDSVKNTGTYKIYRGIYYSYYTYAYNDLTPVATSPSSDTISGYASLDTVGNLKQNSVYSDKIELQFYPINDNYIATKTTYKIYRSMVEDFDTTNYCIGDTATNVSSGTLITYKDSSATYPLNSGKVYYYRVYALRDVASQIYASCSAYTGMSAPDSVWMDTLKNCDVIKIKWNKVKGLAANAPLSYYIYRSETLSGSFAFIDQTRSIDDTSYVDANVQRAKIYYYKVQGRNTIAQGDTSKVSEKIYLTPRKPIIDSITKGKYSDSINIYWQKSENADYRILYKKSGDPTFDFINDGTAISTDATKFSFKKTSSPNVAEEGKKYLFKIYAQNSIAGSSDTTLVDSGWLKISAPTIDSVQKYKFTPSGAIQNIDTSSIKIYWRHNSNFDSIIVYRENSLFEANFNAEDIVGGINISASTSGAVDSFVDSSAIAKDPTKYYYKLQAYSKTFGLSNLSNVNSGHIRMKVPTGFRANAMSNFIGKIEVAWDEMKNADSLKVVMLYNSTTKDTMVNGKYVLFDGLQYSINYRFCISSYSKTYGYSLFSDTVGPLHPIVPAPSNLKASRDMKDTIMLTWDTLIGYPKYTIQRYNDTSNTYKNVPGAVNFQNDTFYDVHDKNTNNLISGYPYKYRVCATVLQNYSDEASGYTAVHAPDSLSVVKEEDENFIISWKYNNDTAYNVSSYVVYRKVIENSGFNPNSFSQSDSIATVIAPKLTQKLINSASSETIERGRRYVYKVAALSNLSTKKLMSTDTVSSFIRMSAPTNIVAKKTSDSVTICWDKKKYATSYKVELINNTALKHTDTTADTFFVHKKGTATQQIEEGIIYKTRVTPLNDYTNNAISDSVAFSLPPQLPKVYSASKDSSNFIKIRWKYVMPKDLIKNYYIIKTQLSTNVSTITYLTPNEIGNPDTDTLKKVSGTPDTVVYKDYYSLQAGYRYSYNVGLVSTINDTVYDITNVDTGWIRLTPPTYYDTLFGNPSIGTLDTIKVMWQAVAGNMLNYSVEMSEKSDFSNILATKNINNNPAKEVYSYLFTKTTDNIIPGKYYYFRVRSKADFASYSNYYVYSSYGCAKLPIPYYFKAIYQSKKVNLYFCDSTSHKDSVAYYIIYRNSDSLGSVLTLGSDNLISTQVRYTDSTTLPGSGIEYIYGIKSVHKSLSACNSDIDTSYLGKVPIDAPSSITVSKNLVDTISMTWERPDYVTDAVKDKYSYNIYMAKTINGEYTKIISSIDTFYRINFVKTYQMELGKYYYFKTTIYCKEAENQESSFSPIDSGVALLNAPDSSYFKITPYNDSIKIAVNAFNDNAQRIRLYYKKYKSNDNYTQIDSINLGTSDRIITHYKVYNESSLSNKFSRAYLYNFKATSVNDLESPKTDSIVGGIRKKLNVSATKYKDSIKISWEDMSSSDISKYIVYRHLLQNSAITPNLRTDTAYFNTNISSFVDSANNSTFKYNEISKNLEVGRLYQYEVLAYADNNYLLSYSSTVVSQLKIPAPVVSKTVYQDRIFLYWNKLPYIDAYKVYQKQAGNYVYITDKVGDTTYTKYNNEIVYDSCYDYKVRAFNSATFSSQYLDSSDYSEACKVFLKPNHPILTSKYKDQLTITLSWYSLDSAKYKDHKNSIKVYIIKDDNASSPLFADNMGYTATKDVTFEQNNEISYKIFSKVVLSATDTSVSDTSGSIFAYKIIPKDTFKVSPSVNSLNDTIVKVTISLVNSNYRFKVDGMGINQSPTEVNTIYDLYKNGNKIHTFNGLYLAVPYVYYDTCSSDSIVKKQVYHLQAKVPYANIGSSRMDTLNYYSVEKDTFYFPAPAVSNFTATKNFKDSIKLTWTLPLSSADERIVFIDSLVIYQRNAGSSENTPIKKEVINSIVSGEKTYTIADSSIYEYEIKTYSSYSGNTVDAQVNSAKAVGFSRLFVSKSLDNLTVTDSTDNGQIVFKRIGFSLKNLDYSWVKADNYYINHLKIYKGTIESGYNIIFSSGGEKSADTCYFLVTPPSTNQNYFISLRSFSTYEINVLTNYKGNYLNDYIKDIYNNENLDYFLQVNP